MISDIGVPKDLEAEGYTSAIAALRLHDALDNYANTANSTFQSTPRYLSDEEPTVEVPSLGLPLDYVADTTAHLLRFLRFPERQRLSGEITEQGKRQLALVLRLNDSVIVDATSPPKHGDVSSSDSDLLFQQAAKAAFQETDPYIVASHLYHEGNSIAAWAVAEAISDGSMPSDAKNNTMAHVLLATIYTDEGKYEFAERNIAEALQADDNLPVAHYNLSRLYFDDQEDTGRRPYLREAVCEGKIASALDKRWSYPHLALGSSYYMMRDDDQAIDEFSQAIKDGFLSPGYLGLGLTLASEDKNSQAEAKLKTSIEDSLSKTSRSGKGLIKYPLADAETFVRLGHLYGKEPQCRNKSRCELAIHQYWMAINIIKSWPSGGSIRRNPGSNELQDLGEAYRGLVVDYGKERKFRQEWTAAKLAKKITESPPPFVPIGSNIADDACTFIHGDVLIDPSRASTLRHVK